MTTNERRAAWRQYACAALANPRCPTSDDAAESAGDMLKLEDECFGEDEVGVHAALATARAHALEQQTRAENAEMALRDADARAARINRLAESTVRDLKAQLAASVPAVPVGELVDAVECVRACVRVHRYAANEGEALNYEDIANMLAALCTAAEQRAAAKPAEGGEPRMSDAVETAWGIIANAYGGNWGDASQEWQDAAARWRDKHVLGRPAERLDVVYTPDRGSEPAEGGEP